MDRDSTSIEQAEMILRQRLGYMVRDLRVLMDANGVVLQGIATSWYGKQLAQHLASQLIGHPIVVNGIEVRPPPQETGEMP